MDKKTINRLFKYLKKNLFMFIISVILGIITVAIALYIPYTLGNGIDYIVGKDNVNLNGLKHILINVVILASIYALALWAMLAIHNHIVYSMTKNIRDEAFRKIQHLPIKYIDSNPYGEVVSKVISDVENLQDGLILTFNQLFTGIITIIGTLGFMYYLNWVIATVVVVITPVSLFIAKLIASKTYKMFKNQSEIRALQTGFVDEVFSSLKTVQAYALENENDRKFEEINNKLEKCSLKATFISSLVNPSTRFVNSLVFAGVCLAGALICTNKIGSLTITIGCLSTFFSYASQYTKPFNEISSVISELENSLACASRIFDLIDENEEEVIINSEKLEDVKGTVELENVNFSYDKNKQLITNFNMIAHKGEKIAIVGATGSGKTTLINLLMRFYDVDSGTIKVDDKNIYGIDRHSLREAYGMVLQDTWIKNASVKENISLGKPDATMDEIIEASKLAHCDNFISRLPNGYETIIKDDGNLSAGERQLLCIARIMLALPPMVILDEATSNIDTRTELKIQEAFNKLTNNRTSFIVAHRLQTIKNADRILVIDNGNIVEQGTHNELLKLNGVYSNLYNSQFPK